MSRVYLLPLSIFVIVTTVALATGAPSALAANCDLNVCVAYCQKRGPQAALGNYCTRNCLVVIDERKKKGQCK
jgi:hypothetical protein